MIMIMRMMIMDSDSDNDAASNLLQLPHTRHVGQAHLDIRLGQHLGIIMIMIVINGYNDNDNDSDNDNDELTLGTLANGLSLASSIGHPESQSP